MRSFRHDRDIECQVGCDDSDEEGDEVWEFDAANDAEDAGMGRRRGSVGPSPTHLPTTTTRSFRFSSKSGWGARHDKVAVGSDVLVRDEGNQRAQWRRAIVTAVHADGSCDVRFVDVRGGEGKALAASRLKTLTHSGGTPKRWDRPHAAAGIGWGCHGLDTAALWASREAWNQANKKWVSWPLYLLN